LMDQAVQQGIVGANMKDVNQKILDILIAIGDVLGAKIPDALRGLPGAAQAAANGMNAAFSSVQTPNLGQNVWNPYAPHMDENGEYQAPEIFAPGDSWSPADPIMYHEGQQDDTRFRNLTVNVQGNLIHQDELASVVTSAVIDSVRANTNSSFTSLRAALEMPT
jgi:hypothetical protein